MPTLDLGKIKFVWRGAWASATAYTVDDVARYSGSSYICVTAHTSTAGAGATGTPDQAANWNLLAQGSDLTILNTQGQLLFHGASGLQALAPSTAGFILTTNGAGADPSFASAASIVDPASRISKLRYPSFGHGLQGATTSGSTGFHAVSQDGRVYHSGPLNTWAGAGSGAAVTTGSTTLASMNSVPCRQCNLPRGAKAVKVFDFFDTSYVIDTDGRLYAAGDGATGKLAMGLSANGAAGVPTADVTDRSKYNEVTFPTHDYPSSGLTNRPKIVHIFSSCQDNVIASEQVFAIDSHGFVWAWGSNTANSVLGIGAGYGTIIYNPVRIPTFMASGTVAANSTINQPAASGSARKRVKKVTCISPNSEFFALVELADTNLSTESGVFYWGTNSGSTATTNATAAYFSTPVQFSRSALGLNAGESVVDFIANASESTATQALGGTLTILTSAGRMLVGGYNTAGVFGNGGQTNNFGNLTAIPFAGVSGASSWATPASTWTVPAGMSTANFNVEWTPETYTTQYDAVFDTTWSFHGQMRYARTNNHLWSFWGTQSTTAVGAAGIGNLTAAQYTPVALQFRDSQHEDTFEYRTASDAFNSWSQTIGNSSPGFTIKKVITCGGNDLLAIGTIVIMSNDRVYVSGQNAQGAHGAGDLFLSTGYFRRARIDSSILQGGQKTIVDARVTRGQASGVLVSCQILLSSGEVYSWGGSNTGSSGLSFTSPSPVRVAYGAETRAGV